jgi:UDP-N-acetylglucosamine--N-acetylmuramyl-(pentapeptide) pyrophosphoryl-undecaprenol N-acetylglucosamine transferase
MTEWFSPVLLNFLEETLAKLRILIAGGGTGGHIIPALAVARELVDQYSADILFVGTNRGMELKLVPDAGFRLRTINVGPLKNVSIATRMRTLLHLPGSIAECRRFIRDFNPGAVLGVGGYASGPAMAAALMMKVPTMVFEPNAMPGLANRLVGKKVRAAAVNFASAERWFHNCEVTGIPVRPEFFHLHPPAGTVPHLLVFGGSQGARIFNNNLPKVIEKLLDAVPGLTVLHQGGVRNGEATQAAYEATGADKTRWVVKPFINDMPEQFAQAHLVMARSGASTVAELAAAGKPGLLVPFAAAADEHQRRNAEVMVASGAAAMLQENELEQPNKLLETLVGLLSSPERLVAMGAAARELAHPHAAERIAEMLVELAG